MMQSTRGLRISEAAKNILTFSPSYCARSLSILLCLVGRDRRLALGPELFHALPMAPAALRAWHDRRRAVSDVDIKALGEQLPQLLLGDCAKGGC